MVKNEKFQEQLMRDEITNINMLLNDALTKINELPDNLSTVYSLRASNQITWAINNLDKEFELITMERI